MNGRKGRRYSGRMDGLYEYCIETICDDVLNNGTFCSRLGETMYVVFRHYK